MFPRETLFKLAWPVVTGCVVLAVSSCGDRQAEAKQELSAKAFTFTVEEFMRAAREGNVSALRHFVEAGMAVDVKDGEGSTALFRAAQAGRAEAVRFLLGQKARTDLTGVGFDTPLVAAARGGSAEAVEALLAAGADPAFRTDKNWTALTAAAFGGEVECVKRLAPESRDSLDEALQIAALQGKTEVIDCLLAAGADVFSRSRENRTPLMFAAANGHADAVRLLLLHGSNPLALESKDQTAADLAAAAGHPEVVALLNEPKSASLLARNAVAGSAVRPGSAGSGDTLAAAESTATGPGGEAPRDLATDPSAEVAGPGGAATEATRPGGPPRPPDTIMPVDAAPPPARLHGSTLAGLSDGTTASVRDQVRMKDFRESQLPIILEEVGGEGASARIRVLGGGKRTSEIVLAGGEIAGTGLELVKAERKFMPSKMGDGQALDVSQATVIDKATGQRHRIVRNATAKSSQPAALISAGAGGDLYEVREGDEFTAGDTQPARYRVLDVRPTQVVVENLDTRETVTLARAYGR